jgi:NAD(P)-dependent dehydrogenase (short-subunit alcohol dehydrogenase family)
MQLPDFLGLQDAAILVTGASSGIGREVAVRASQQGARLALVARDPDRLEAVKAELAGDGHIVVPFDLTDSDAVPGMVSNVSRQLGPLSGLVHAAGLHLAMPLKSMRSEEAQKLMNVNVIAAMMLAKGFRVRSAHTASASLVFISSAMGLVGQPSVSAYSATKGAVLSLTKSLALELVRDGIRVNCVAPGVALTEMTEKLHSVIGDDGFRAVEDAHPLGLGKASDVADAILFLLSNSAARWITGSTLSVDGGYTAQ